MMAFLDKFGMVGSAGQSPVAFPCSFAASLPATASILQTGGGVTSAPGTPDLLAASDSGASATDNVTSDTTPAFRVGLPVEAIAGDTVRVYRAGSTEIGSAALDAGDVVAGFVDVTAAALSAGGHSITARVENGAGLSPSSAGLAIAVDTAAPDAPTAIIVAPADQGSGTLQTDDTQPAFRISLPANAVAGDVATLEIDTVDDATAALIAGDIANGYVDIQSASVLADDTLYDISAFITDAAGNQGASSAAVELEVGDASGNAIPAVVYDGVQGYMLHTGGPAGAADGAALTVVWAGTFNSDGSAMTLLDIPGSVPVKLTRNADNTISFAGGAAGAVFENVTAAVAASLGFLIVLASCDGAASVMKVVHAAGTITGTNTPGAAASLDLTTDWFLGSDGGSAEFLDADTALWWIDGQHIDFADADSIEQFWDTTGDTLRDPGADGSNPLDGAFSPLVCHKSSAAGHATNAGPGGDADEAGIFADGASPGTYAEDIAAATVGAVEFTTPTASAFAWGNPGTSGGADSDKVTLVVWYKLVTLPSVVGNPQTIINFETANLADSLQLIIDSADNKIKLRNMLAVPTVSLISNIAETLDGSWHCAMMSFDGDVANGGASTVCRMYRDGTDMLTGGATAPSTNIDLTRPTKIGGRLSAGGIPWPYEGQLAMVWYNHGLALDFSSSTQRDKFYDAGKFVDVGATGSAPTGTAPRICMKGDATSFPTEVGLGSNPTNNIAAGLTTVTGPVAA